MFPWICSCCVSSTPFSDSSFAHVGRDGGESSAHTVMKMNDAERAVCGPAACHCSSRSAVSVHPAHSNAPIVKRIGSPKAAAASSVVCGGRFSSPELRASTATAAGFGSRRRGGAACARVAASARSAAEGLRIARQGPRRAASGAKAGEVLLA